MRINTVCVVVLSVLGCGGSHSSSPPASAPTAPSPSSSLPTPAPASTLTPLSQPTTGAPTSPPPSRCGEVRPTEAQGDLATAMRSPHFRFPLDRDAIDLDRIDRFLALYAASEPEDSPVETARREVLFIRANWCGLRVLRLGDDVETVTRLVSSAAGQPQNPYAFLSRVYNVLVGTGHALTVLKSRHGRSMTEKLRADLDEQLGVDAHDGAAIYRENIEQLQDLKNEATPESVKRVLGQ